MQLHSMRLAQNIVSNTAPPHFQMHFVHLHFMRELLARSRVHGSSGRAASCSTNDGSADEERCAINMVIVASLLARRRVPQGRVLLCQ